MTLLRQDCEKRCDVNSALRFTKLITDHRLVSGVIWVAHISGVIWVAHIRHPDEIRMLCSVIINSVLLNLLCVWI